MHLHVVTALQNGANFEVQFLPWSLSQGYREGDLDVWDDPGKDGDLVALAASVSVRDQQPEHFLNAHRALFEARHLHANRLHTFDEVASVLSSVHVDVEAVAADIETRRPHQLIGESHRRLEPYEVFGVPTFVIGDDAVFVRYMEPPTNDVSASIDLVGGIVDMMVARPSLNEFKHTKLPA
jgi:hypothetical protein